MRRSKEGKSCYSPRFSVEKGPGYSNHGSVHRGKKNQFASVEECHDRRLRSAVPATLRHPAGAHRETSVIVCHERVTECEVFSRQKHATGMMHCHCQRVTSFEPTTHVLVSDWLTIPATQLLTHNT
ncbi:hypothetical protein BaRGS_00011641 [Batillaria attramentaria]|uniref:Uncharacterized protein n=1 Tax=Batillaria attramentaria TaxID=370345 RepID=A0ABD0LCB4_9CAEN